MRQLAYTKFSTSNHNSLHLWWKKNLVKHQKVWKYYDQDCSFGKEIIFIYVWVEGAPKFCHLIFLKIVGNENCCNSWLPIVNPMSGKVLVFVLKPKMFSTNQVLEFLKSNISRLTWYMKWIFLYIDKNRKFIHKCQMGVVWCGWVCLK